MAGFSSAELVKIRDLVLQDSVALTKWVQIVDHAIKLAADVESIKTKLRGQDPNYAEAVLQTLKTWNSYGEGIQVELMTVLETNKLNSLADKIRALEFQGKNAQSKSGQGSNPGPSSTSRNGCYQHISLPNLAINFVERESKLQELHELVTRPCGVNKSAYALLTGLYGLGGIGKTTLARRYVDYFKDRFPDASVFWIEAETNSTLRIAFRHLAKALCVLGFDTLDTKVLVESVYERVHNLTCLFVFDNVTEYDGTDGIYTFLPHPSPGPHHYILATSRKADLLGRVDPNDRILQLDVLSEREADELIRKALPNSLSTPRKDLYTTLGRLPLALQQAISYIFQSKGTFANESYAIESYLRDLNDNSRKLKLLQCGVLNEDGRKNERTVYLTWQTTLATIARQEHEELAVTLLRAMSYLNPDNIDHNFLSTLNLKFTFLSTLKDKSSLTLSKIIKKKMNHSAGQLNENYSTKETETVRAAVLLLSKYSMVTLQDGFVSVHRLVQDVARLTMSDHNVEESVMLFRIINHIYQCRDTNLVEQCALHGAAVVPFYEKYTRLKRYFPDFEETVFEEKRLLEHVLKKLSTKNRAAALRLIANLERTELAIDTAVSCISGMKDKSAFDIYVGTLSKVTRDKTYSPMEAVTIANWLVVIRDTSDTLSSLIMRLLPYLNRSALSSEFFCELLKANKHVFNGAVKNLKQYGIDMKTVSLPTKDQIKTNWENYSADLKMVVSHLGKGYIESGQLMEELVLHAIHLRKENWISPVDYDTLRSEDKRVLAIGDTLLKCTQNEEIQEYEYKDAIYIANMLTSEPAALANALKFKRSCSFILFYYELKSPTPHLVQTQDVVDESTRVSYNFHASVAYEFILPERVKYVNWIVARVHTTRTAHGYEEIMDTLLFLDESDISVHFIRVLFSDVSAALSVLSYVRQLNDLKLIRLKGPYTIDAINIPVSARGVKYWPPKEWIRALCRVVKLTNEEIDFETNAELKMQCVLHGCYIYNHVNIPEELELEPDFGILLAKFKRKLKPYAEQTGKTGATNIN